MDSSGSLLLSQVRCLKMPPVISLFSFFSSNTYAGFHSDGLIATQLARDYAERGMLAYVERIQRTEEREKIPTLTHQKWSGTQLVDAAVGTITGGAASTLSMGKGVTEVQFGREKGE